MPGAVLAESDVHRGHACLRRRPRANLLTVNLVCDEFTGDVIASDSWLTAIFAPN